MQLLRASAVAPDPTAQTFRHSPMGDLLMCVVMGGLFVAFAVGAVLKTGELSTLEKVGFAIPFLLIMITLYVLTVTMFRAYRASLKPSNWFARLKPEELQLNLRSYRNAHFGGDELTVVSMQISEIASMRKVLETRSQKRKKGTVIRSFPAIELRPRNSDTEALEDALHEESYREAPDEKIAGGTSRTKHHHLPVTVLEPGLLRVEWDGELFAALSAHVNVEPELRVNFDAAFPSSDPGKRAHALALRGDRFHAMRIVTGSMGMKVDEARQWLAEEGRRSA